MLFLVKNSFDRYVINSTPHGGTGEEMENYVIFTDSSCDLSEKVIKDWGICSASLSFRFEGSDKEYLNNEISVSDFYAEMRKGGVAKTSAVNSEAFISGFTPLLDKGLDILYIGFSSGLSTTFNSARLAAEALKEKYPERKIYIVDTLAASAGTALLIDMIRDKMSKGASIEEARDFAEESKLHICHWFTVDDLVYLKRGGRVSPTTAFVGNVLGIKPVLHVDNEGHLTSVLKVRGRRASINALAEKYGETASPLGTKAFISHSDCEADAKILAGILKEKYGAETELITDVGPVIGAHSGPGTLALFFYGTER